MDGCGLEGHARAPSVKAAKANAAAQLITLLKSAQIWTSADGGRSAASPQQSPSSSKAQSEADGRASQLPSPSGSSLVFERVNPKSKLLTLCHRKKLPKPVYKIWSRREALQQLKQDPGDNFVAQV